MDSNISFLLFSFWGLISNFQLEITFRCSLSLFTFTKECNLLFCICHFLSLLVCSYFKIKLAHFQCWNYISFLRSRPWTILQTYCFVWRFLRQDLYLFVFYWAFFFSFPPRWDLHRFCCTLNASRSCVFQTGVTRANLLLLCSNTYYEPKPVSG